MALRLLLLLRAITVLGAATPLFDQVRLGKIAEVPSGALPVPEVGALLSSNNDWQCDIRCYVRAPDLRPIGVFDGDARLRFHGSSCAELERWSVGLRLKERAVVRVKFVLSLPTLLSWYRKVSAEEALQVIGDAGAA